MTVALIFPPPFDLSQPYLSLPTLTGFLRRNGIPTTQWDLNIGFYDFVLSDTYLARICDLLDNAAARVPAGSADAGAIMRAQTLLPHLLGKVDRAKAQIRDGTSFHSSADYERDIRYLHRACEIVSAAHYPTELTLSTYLSRHSTDSFDAIFEAVECRTENPLIAYLEEQFLSSLAQENPTLIGLSLAYTHQLIPACTIVRALKSRLGVPVILGGELISRMIENPTVQHRRLLEIADGLALGDGADALLSSWDAVQKGGPLPVRPNLITALSRPDTEVRRSLPPNLDHLGSPDFSGLSLNSYLVSDPVLPILSGDGCAWGKCVFCTESLAPRFVTRSISALLDDIATLSNATGARYFTFADSDIPPSRLREIASGLIARGIDIRWSCYARLTKAMDSDLIALLATAGCRQIYFGLESASPRILRIMKKGIQVELVPTMLTDCRRHGIAVHLFAFIGFPSETREEASLTGSFILENIENIHSFNLGVFSLRSHSKLYAEISRFDTTARQSATKDGDQDSLAYDVTAGLSMNEAAQLSRESVDRISRSMADRGIEHSCCASSGFVIRDHVPAMQSHSLLVLSQKGAEFHKPADNRASLSNGVLLSVDGDARTMFVPQDGRIVRVTPKIPSAGASQRERFSSAVV